MRYLLLAALLLSGCEPHDLDVPRIEDKQIEELHRMAASPWGTPEEERRIAEFVEAAHAAWARMDSMGVMDSSYIASHTVSMEHLFSDSLTNTGPHAVVLSNGERCLLLRPGESGVWSGDAEISTPDGYEKEDIK